MDIARLLQNVLGSDAATSLKDRAKSSGMNGGSMLGGAAAGSLLTMVLGNKKGRKMGGTALKYGGAALLAGLAYKAYSDYKSNKAPQHESIKALPPAPTSGRFSIVDEVDISGGDFRLAIVRAMIAAAKSDGHIDAEEHARIKTAIAEQNLSGEEKGFLISAFSDPADPVAIASLASTEEQGAELYAASRLAIDPDDPTERRYLDRLAGALRLPQGLIDHLDTKIEDARQELSAQQ